ncbi:DUF3455 domain-containing protein [Actinomadura barringtoniae]|uniref:DUF3455 domain-containing protein n=1 Tax=Actinomadura barringtoniae TaxID=1427535 RepID=A0A939T1V0_9ACTN|nr:DUF3455 domain-containing protein [Actinomadura barringtoniae]MBO2445478.1 DUF3455 domain-containing protein [Actinomadura barringtoniae]
MNRSIALTAVVAAGLAFMAVPASADEDAFFATSLNGANVTQGGDDDGGAVAFVGVKGDQVSFAIEFHDIAIPTSGDLHKGAKGSDGDSKISFFTTPLLTGRDSVSGTVRVTDQKLLDDLRTAPGDFYVDLHNRPFPQGAVRGQVHKTTSAIDMKRALSQNFAAPVIKGVQIYACTQQPDGTFAFTQDNVRASLQRGISHFFANPGPAGPPEWKSDDDGSAVTGKLISKTANGDGDIAELDLAATQVGAASGLLAQTNEIMRLNTVGGVAPAGPCDPAAQPKAEVPYHADYLFIHAA